MKFKVITAVMAALAASSVITSTASAAQPGELIVITGAAIAANTAKQGFVYGDLDGDGQLTISDLVKIRLYIAGYNVSIPNPAAADVNCDGAIDAADVDLMKRASVGLATLPVKNSIEYIFSDMVVPSVHNVGYSFYLGGTVTSRGGNLSYVLGEILDSNNNVVMSAVSYPSGNSLNLKYSTIDNSLKFGQLPVGDYTLKYIAVGQDNSSKSVSYSFSIRSKAQNENTIYEFLRNEMGYNKAAAVAVLANINAESGFNPNLYGDNGTSYGICQWHNGRLSAMKNFCVNNGYDYTSLYGQLKYLQYDLTRNYRSVDSYLRSVPNDRNGAYNGAAYFCKVFEVPANKDYMANLRGNSAMNTYWYRH